MKYSYVGLIKKNSQNSKILVLSEEGNYYVWEKSPDFSILSFLDFPFDIPSNKLSLATPRQIEVGRGTLWVPNASQIMISVIYQGVVSGGRSNKTILVTSISGDWQVTVVPYDSIKDIKRGDSLIVDQRRLLPAREDHIKAGLGYGKLKRKKRVVI